jgi:cbb3-type cytochrome oxidase subunit 3
VSVSDPVTIIWAIALAICLVAVVKWILSKV